MALPCQPCSSVYEVWFAPIASSQVQLKGAEAGIPKAVRLPFRLISAARTSRTSRPGKSRLIGSDAAPATSVPVKGQSVSEPAPNGTATRGDGAVVVLNAAG